MKKLIMVLISMMVIVPAYALELDLRGSLNNERPYNHIYNTFIKVGFPVAYKDFSITPWGSWDTWAEFQNLKPSGLQSARPFQETYGMGVKLEFKGLFVEYSHFCRHNVMSDIENNPNWETSQKWSESLSLITIGYHTRTDWRPFE
jgi:hypothetical protein